MKHRVKKHTFNRDTKHRQAMLKNGLRNLILHGEIKTTHGKAREYKRLADKFFNQALDNSVVTRRQLHRFFGKRNIVNTLVERIMPAMSQRQSGFTRIKKLGSRRGDNAQLVKLELVEKSIQMGDLKNSRSKKVIKKKKTIAKKTVSKKIIAKTTSLKIKKNITKSAITKKKTESKK